METTTTTNNDHRSLAAKYAAEDRWIDAKRELVQVENKDALTPEEQKLIERGERIEADIASIKKGIDPSWKDLGESKKNGRFFRSAYHIQWGPFNAGLELEYAIERSLFRYMVVVLNEVDLLSTWTPRWGAPTRLEFVRTEVLRRRGTTQSVATVRVIAPLATVEVYVNMVGNNDTVTNREGSATMEALAVGDEDGLIPAPEEGVRRAKLSGTLLCRKCPEEIAAKAKKMKGKKAQEQNEEYLLCNLKAFYGNDQTVLKGGFFVRNLANFVLKIAVPILMNKLFTICEEVRDGKHPEFDKKIAENSKCIEWYDNVTAGILRDD